MSRLDLQQKIEAKFMRTDRERHILKKSTKNEENKTLTIVNDQI